MAESISCALLLAAVEGLSDVPGVSPIRSFIDLNEPLPTFPKIFAMFLMEPVLFML